MVTVVVSCPHCQSDRLVRNGATPDGRQRYQCRACGRRSTYEARSNRYTPEQQETILRACHERASLRGVARIFGLSRTTVSAWLEKKQPPCRP